MIKTPTADPTKEMRRQREVFINELFESIHLVKCGPDAMILKELILKGNKDDKFEFWPFTDPTLSSYLKDKNYIDDLENIWINRGLVNPNVPWHKIIDECSSNFDISDNFLKLPNNLFPENSLERNCHELLFSVYDKFEEYIVFAVSDVKFISQSVSLPSVTKLIAIFGPIADYLKDRARN